MTPTSQRKTTIYGLCDPRTGQLRYVGKTCKALEKRLREHVVEAGAGVAGYKNNWVRQLLVLNLAPEPFVIEVAIGDGSVEEIHHIAQLRALGCDLTNTTRGGDGVMAGRKHTPEARARMSAAARKRKVAAGLKRAPMAPEARLKLSLALKGRTLSSETRAKMSAARVGKIQTTETCDKRSASLKRYHGRQ